MRTPGKVVCASLGQNHRILKVHGVVAPASTLSPLTHYLSDIASRDLTSPVLPFDRQLSVPIVNVYFIAPLITTFWVVANDTREQRPNAIRRATIALAVHNVLPRLDPCCLGSVRGGQIFEVQPEYKYIRRQDFQNRKNAAPDPSRPVRA